MLKPPAFPSVFSPALRPVVRRSAAMLFVPAVAALSACTPNEPASNVPGTTPPVWTGSPPPAGMESHGGPGGSHGGTAEGAGGMAHGGGAPAAAPAEDTLTAEISGPDGSQIAAATIAFRDGFATVTVQTTRPGQLTPGSHGMHIHNVGKCEPNSVAPGGGAPGDFLSAGGHFQGRGGADHPSHAGDLTSLQVREDGSAMVVTTTGAFTMEELLAEPGTAIIIHDGPDNFANIPADRYRQADGSPPPDATTLATGDAGKRVACGVISAG